MGNANCAVQKHPVGRKGALEKQKVPASERGSSDQSSGIKPFDPDLLLDPQVTSERVLALTNNETCEEDELAVLDSQGNPINNDVDQLKLLNTYFFDMVLEEQFEYKRHLES